MDLNSCLFIIPARAGSKGVPGKNIRSLSGKPLIQYSIEYALNFTDPSRICITTDDDRVMEIGKSLGIPVPFKRPAELASDTASANDVIKHAFDFYKTGNKNLNTAIYLQPTSPFRLFRHFIEAFQKYESQKPDMVVSVCESQLNPYFSLFEENPDGNLIRSKKMPVGVTRRQDVPKTYLYNGSIYIINMDRLQESRLHELANVKKYVMDAIYATDIDTETDWKYAEFLLKEGLVDFDLAEKK